MGFSAIGADKKLLGAGMIQLTPQMRILLFIPVADFRKGIDGLAGICLVVIIEN